MKWRCWFAALCFAISGCSDFPRDTDGTLDRIRRDRAINVGLVAPLGPGRLDDRAARLIAQVASAAGASVKLYQGDQERLFDRLEEGDVDMVVGRFHGESPWAKLVSFGPVLLREKQGKTEFLLTAAMKNGENGFISLVEREARNIAPDVQ